MPRIGIIFCANEKHYYKDHPEQPGRVLKAQKLLTQNYPSLIFKARDYEPRYILDFLNNGNHNVEHWVIIARRFSDINSSYSTGLNSYDACLEECKCLMTMCDLIKEDKIDYALNIIRPPGHHCCNKKPAGFCLVNIAILSAYSLLQKYKKVNIFDIDLHHGGGTQKMMERNKSISYSSIHNKNVWSDGLYQRGINGKTRDGRIINVALPGLSGNTVYLDKSEMLINEMTKFTKEVLILSVGFDAHRDEECVGDIKSHRMDLTSNYYGMLSNMLGNKFDKIFVVLEGGYNEEAISESLDLMVKGFLSKKID